MIVIAKKNTGDAILESVAFDTFNCIIKLSNLYHLSYKDVRKQIESGEFYIAELEEKRIIFDLD